MGLKDVHEAERTQTEGKRTVEGGGGEVSKEHSSGLEIPLHKAPVPVRQLITQSICLHPCVVSKWVV